jgi:hypothetical protein
MTLNSCTNPAHQLDHAFAFLEVVDDRRGRHAQDMQDRVALAAGIASRPPGPFRQWNHDSRQADDLDLPGIETLQSSYDVLVLPGKRAQPALRHDAVDDAIGDGLLKPQSLHFDLHREQPSCHS